jgi:hypothetical protein
MRWTVYLDESGTHDASPILVMGAVAATAGQWQIFDRQWVGGSKLAEVTAR